jgi:hypothetical protein
MKEIFERLVGLIPAYFEALFPLLTGPKRFIAERLSSDESAMEKALIFLAISFAIGWILKIPLSRSGDPLLDLGTGSVFQLMNVLAYGTALYLAWRIAGGRAGLQKFLTIHFYYAGVLLLLETGLYLGFAGTIRAFDPALFKELHDAIYAGNFAAFLIENHERLLASSAYRASFLVQFAGFGAMLAWIFAGWGAYRALNRLSRLRSMGAGLLFFIFCLPVTGFIFVVGNALVK